MYPSSNCSVNDKPIRSFFETLKSWLDEKSEIRRKNNAKDSLKALGSGVIGSGSF